MKPGSLSSLLFLLLVGFEIQAACTSPAAAIGSLQFHSSKLYYCNNSSVWIDTTADNTAVGSCAGTPAGRFVYEPAAGEKRYRFCDGLNWYSMKGAAGSACSDEGSIDYESSSGMVRFCDGTKYYNVGGAAALADPCAGKNIGEACAGTTAIYAGQSGAFKYMITPTDSSLFLTSGDLTVFVATSRSDGAANSNNILGQNLGATISNSAPKYCAMLSLANATSGWYVPSIEELLTIVFPNKLLIPGIQTTTFSYYWSSTQSGTTAKNAVRLNFGTGAEDAAAGYYGGTAVLVRCLRKYTP